MFYQCGTFKEALFVELYCIYMCLYSCFGTRGQNVLANKYLIPNK